MPAPAAAAAPAASCTPVAKSSWTETMPVRMPSSFLSATAALALARSAAGCSAYPSLFG